MLNWIELTSCLGTFSLQKALDLCSAIDSGTYVSSTFGSKQLFAQNSTIPGNMHKQKMNHLQSDVHT